MNDVIDRIKIRFPEIQITIVRKGSQSMNVENIASEVQKSLDSLYNIVNVFEQMPEREQISQLGSIEEITHVLVKEYPNVTTDSLEDAASVLYSISDVRKAIQLLEATEM